MTTISIHHAITNLNTIVAETIDNQEETVIVTDNGSVVMLEQHYWESVQETLRFLKDKKSLKALLEGHKNRRENKAQGITLEEAFYDL